MALIFDFIECFTTTFLRAHSWLNWVVQLMATIGQLMNLHMVATSIRCATRDKKVPDSPLVLVASV